MNLHFSHVGFTFLWLCLSSTQKDLDNLHRDKFYAWDNMKVAEIFEKFDYDYQYNYISNLYQRNSV